MNAKKYIITAASATAIASLLSAAPSQAASFGNSGILFDTNTTVNFDFLQSNGWWRGEFGVAEVNANGSLGALTTLISETRNVDPGSGSQNDSFGSLGVGKAVENGNAAFTFSAGKNYSFFLKSYDKTTGALQNTVFSTTSLNPNWYASGTGTGAQGGGNFMITNNNYDSSLNGSIVEGRKRTLFSGDVSTGLKMFFEDNTTWGDNDYDDFVVSAKSVPEPATMLGLGLLGGAMALSRRRKQTQLP